MLWLSTGSIVRWLCNVRRGLLFGELAPSLFCPLNNLRMLHLHLL